MSLENVIYQGKTSDTFSGRSGNRKSDFRKLGFEVLAVLIVSYPEEVCSKVIVCSLEMAAGIFVWKNLVIKNITSVACMLLITAS